MLTVDGADLGSGTTRGETYLNVGRASALFSETAAVAGLAPLGLGPFEVDVVLASAYGVYMHTALQMRLTREFSRVIPLVPEMIRRLLGVAHLGAETPCR